VPWVALRYERDRHHARSRAILGRLRRDGMGLVTSEWVMVETVTLLNARGKRFGFDGGFTRAGFVPVP
jgi:predicted nucleic acid-binding protein